MRAEVIGLSIGIRTSPATVTCPRLSRWSEEIGDGLQNRSSGCESRSRLKSVPYAPKVFLAACLAASQRDRVRLPVGALTTTHAPVSEWFRTQPSKLVTRVRFPPGAQSGSVPPRSMVPGGRGVNFPRGPGAAVPRTCSRSVGGDTAVSYAAERGPSPRGSSAGRVDLVFPAEAHNLSLTTGATPSPATALPSWRRSRPVPAT